MMQELKVFNRHLRFWYGRFLLPGIFAKSKYLLVPFSFVFFLIPFWVSCERDFSTIKIPLPTGPDTTSHNFTWTIDTIGTTSSYLLDVAIINQNDIWAVGEIHTAETDTFDSLGNWIPPFNAAHWNEQEWEYIRFVQQTGQVIVPIRGILPIDDTHVWLAAGSIYLWNGNSDKRVILSYQRDITTGEIVKRLWGVSNSNIYGVGNEGIIVRYDGSSWQKLTSGTTVDIQDIWGAKNPQSGEWEILAVASYGPVNPVEVHILRIQITMVTAISVEGLPPRLSSIWFVPGKKYYTVGDGVFYTTEIGMPWQHDSDHPLLYKSAVRGNDINDVIICGGFGLLSHYNGIDWHHYKDNELPSFFGTYGALDFQGNHVVAVGWIEDKAIVLRGIRN